MIQRPSIFALCVAILVALCLRAQAAEPATVVTKGNISIQLPTGWVLNPADGRSLIAARPPQPDKDASGTFQASLSISQNAGANIDGAAQQAIVAKSIAGYIAVEPASPVKIGGLDGVRFGGTFKSGTTDLRTRQYMFSLNNQIYILTFTSLSSSWAAHQPVMEASVATFKVK